MRILVASHGYPPVVSGVTIVAQKVARAMVARGHRVLVVTASDRHDPYEDEDQGVRIMRVRSRSNPFWTEAPIPFVGLDDLAEISDTFQPDVLHTHETALLARQFMRHAHEFALPLLASCHYVPQFVAQYVAEMTRPPVEAVVWAYSIWLLNRCSHVVFANDTHRQIFSDQGLKAPTTIISNGIDMQHYRADGDGQGGVVARYDLPEGRRILFVGRLAKDKSIDVLIRAMRHVPAALNAHLVLVGRGDDRADLQDLTVELGLEHRVHFCGFVEEADMPALYRACDIFAIASTCEVQSLPTLAAMSSALPVIAADALSLPELVKNGINGYLAPAGDANFIGTCITRLLAEPELARRMGQAGLQMVQPHAERYTFDAYEQLYERLAAGQGDA